MQIHPTGFMAQFRHDCDVALPMLIIERTMMSRYFTLIGSVVAVVLLAGCAAVQVREDGPATAQKRTTGFMGLGTKDDVEVSYAPAFKGVTRVVIGGFKVGFNDSKKFSQTSSGILSPATTATALVDLEGIDSSVQQQITDKVYEEFVSYLKQKGFEVVPREQFTSTPEYRAMTQSEFPFKVDQSGIFSSYGVGYYYSPTQIGNKQIFFPGENDADFFSTFGGTSSMQVSDKFSQDTDIRVLGVSLMLDFAGASEGAMFSSTRLEVGQLMSVDKGQIIISRADKGIRTAQTGTVTLGQPVISDKPFAKITNMTSDGDVAMQATANAFVGLLQGGLMGAVSQQASQTREFVYDADPAAYTEAAQEALDKANDMLIDKMAELRA
ncbi:hypothetical protein DBV39_14780 [Orrella marina]|uniref:Uncharacterized protein n=2 Tax=Orrella marina TaxID=2163011 RepID=A0A2R4XM16_9BURK|nr:hypothetical protein DBV39_14780 [Orrella marina]